MTQGRKIRLKGQGSPGIGGAENGDLFIELNIRPHPRFAHDGNDVLSELKLTPWEAMLGTTVAVETLSGDVELKIPEGSQSGNRLRLKGRGLGGDGAQIVTLKVVLPPIQDDEDRALYERMASQMAFDPRT